MSTRHLLDTAERRPDPDAAMSIGDVLLTVHDAARFLNVSVSWVYEHARDGAEDRLPCVKLGKYLRFDRTDLRAYIDAKRASARTTRRPR
jgi:excisionase family DNA binding protein